MRSYLDIFDMETRTARTLLQTDRHIEAPNWTPENDALIVNGEGHLFEVSLEAPALEMINTGAHVELNNDHGISPDGQTLVISDKTGVGQSTIYTLPRKGGAVRRVTQAVPSWWHGWSPDGARHAYTAVRGGEFAIATCALDGSDERILVTSPHHYDGPDYSPDGAWIWFNSDRGGSMQLWRMQPDGSALSQMTKGRDVAWFPHPAPNGRDVLYLAYAEGTKGHPGGQDVELCLLDLDNMTTDRLIGIHGGQGTINVPSWSPDGAAFAYVRYAKED